jgi:DNA-binding LacI/PurR family transcriptional regulator
VGDPELSTGGTASRVEHASILDVASLAGVSPSTVSRSLRGLPNVSDDTRRKVLDAARSLSYVASPSASGLASGRTTTVAIVVPFMTRWFFAQAVAGACEVLRESGYDVLLHHLGSVEARDVFFQRMPIARRVDAVLVLTLPLTEEHTLALRALGMPLVVVGVRMPGITTVRIDDVEGARQAVHHLLHQGHEDIAMVTALDDDLGFANLRERRHGYREAMSAAGLAPRDDLLVASTYGIDGGSAAMEQLLSAGDLPTAVFAEYDELAVGAMRTLARAGMAVPGDLSVVGFDDGELASVMDLTTVSQPVQEQGAVAARLLLDTLAGRLREPADVVLPTRLVIRSSTGRPPARRRQRARRLRRR